LSLFQVLLRVSFYDQQLQDEEPFFDQQASPLMDALGFPCGSLQAVSPPATYSCRGEKKFRP
jgi:hypothetical protein